MTQWNEDEERHSDYEAGVKAERERIIALLVSWDGNERVYNSQGDFDEDCLREALTPK